MIKKEEYLALKEKEYNEWVKDVTNRLNKEYEISLDVSLDEKTRRQAIHNIVFISFEIKEYDPHNRFDKEYYETVFNECERIWRSLEREFKCEWLSDNELAVDINCRSLPYFCKMIANMYDLHSGMFTFDSSFTTHEAFTKSNHKIYLSSLDDGRGLIKFNLLRK